MEKKNRKMYDTRLTLFLQRDLHRKKKSYATYAFFDTRPTAKKNNKRVALFFYKKASYALFLDKKASYAFFLYKKASYGFFPYKNASYAFL